MKKPVFVSSREIDLWERGCVIIGVDEVGRGALAGPIAAGACAFLCPPEGAPIIRDSKKMSEKQRAVAKDWIDKHAFAQGYAEVSAKEIDKRGIQWANLQVMRGAAAQCIKKARENFSDDNIYVFLDFFNIAKKVSNIHVESFVGGESESFCIAAASVYAKVSRDEYMCRLANR